MNDKGYRALRRSFGMKEAVTITVGTVVGVGLFTVGANVVGLMGSAVILPTFVAMLVSVYPALLYAEMGAALPYAGGTYKYASLGLGKPLGMLAGWNFIISLVAVTSGEALAFSFYFKTVFRVLGWELPISDVALACLIAGAFVVTNVCGVEMTGRLQNGFLFFFWGVAVIWFVTMIPNVELGRFVRLPEFVDFSPGSFIGSVAMIWWCFAGFETCCAMGEAADQHPQSALSIPIHRLCRERALSVVHDRHRADGAIGGARDGRRPLRGGDDHRRRHGLSLIDAGSGHLRRRRFLDPQRPSIAVPPRYLFTMARDGAMPPHLPSYTRDSARRGSPSSPWDSCPSLSSRRVR